MANTNPYNYNLPVGPEMFFGREADVQELLDAVTSTPGDSVALIGGRRMGKTSLLEALLRAFETQTMAAPDRLLLPIFLDLSGEWLGSVMDFFSLICTEVESTLSKRLSRDMPRELFLFQEGRPPAPAFGKLLDGWSRAVIAQTGMRLRLTLLLDECERLVEQPWASDLYGALRYLLVGKTTRALLKVVVVGSHGFLTQVRQHGSPLRNVLKYHTLRALDVQATRELVAQPTQGILPETIVTAVVEQSGGHPFFTQYLMYHLWKHGLEGASTETVEQIATQFPHERNDFHDWMEGIGIAGASAYRVLAQENALLTEAQIRVALESVPPDLMQALDALCYHGLVLRDPKKERYQVAGEMFHSWFVSNVNPASVFPPAKTLPDTDMQATSIIVQGDYVAGDKPTGVDQRGQDVHGPQTNIAGDVAGPILSGKFGGPVTVEQAPQKEAPDVTAEFTH
ncbi:MAG: ATP-binding protein [Anaerolineae bacterium]|nr:ATP-binding protein [Anaerolineae bacterium]